MAAQVRKDLEAERFFGVGHGCGAGRPGKLPLGLHNEEADARKYVNRRLTN